MESSNLCLTLWVTGVTLWWWWKTYLTPLSVTSQHPPKLSSLKFLLYFANAYRHLLVTCLLPSRFMIFIHLNFFMKMSIQSSDIATQCERSMSSSLLWCRARASTAPVVNHGLRASFRTRMLWQYKITGCKHLADRFGHWLKFKLTIPALRRSIGIKSASVTQEHRLKFNECSLTQFLVNTCKFQS